MCRRCTLNRETPLHLTSSWSSSSPSSLPEHAASSQSFESSPSAADSRSPLQGKASKRRGKKKSERIEAPPTKKPGWKLPAKQNDINSTVLFCGFFPLNKTKSPVGTTFSQVGRGPLTTSRRILQKLSTMGVPQLSVRAREVQEDTS